MWTRTCDFRGTAVTYPFTVITTKLDILILNFKMIAKSSS